jgi:glycosyltransferase involved in cell wall biosynthesis
MKIAIISPFISTSPDPLFYQSQQLNLAAELQKTGVDVDIITARRSANQPEHSVENGVTVFRLEPAAGWMEKSFNMLLIRGLWRYLKHGGYDFIQSSDDCAPSTLVAALFCRGAGPGLIVYQGVYQYSANRAKRVLMRLQDRLAGPLVRRACRMAVCKTRRAAGFLQQKGFDRVKVIPVGVNRRLFFPERKEPAKRFQLLAVGSLIELKNYPLMLETVKHLAAGGHDIHLTVIGSGPQRERIIGLAEEYGLTGFRFRLLESIPNREMRLHYSRADLLLLLSRREIFGMVILEAMACGCPVLATPTPGALDVIDDGADGYIARSIRPEDLAGQIAGIVADRESLAAVRQRALEKVDRGYGWESIARQYSELYQELAARS